jgi:4a-hydroxytetrahydrobiopterin dehydratase
VGGNFVSGRSCQFHSFVIHRYRNKPMWQEQHNQLCRTFSFNDFREAFAFMTEVAFIAEAQQHHPEWTNVYNTVNVNLSTHDAGNVVTEKDHALAKAMDAVYARYTK